jgi:predicted alpha-1,2-mannosidase
MNLPLRLPALFLLLFSLQAATQKLTDKVDVFLGTGGHGHVYPGATVPFGMVQLSPDNGVEGWDWCSGYHYSSDSIAGFSHTHLSGTGIGDWCDISVMPLLQATDSRKTKAAFQHARESGRPGFYSVQLNNGIDCRMTATERVGYHQYRFPGNEGWIQFDMGFRINWDKATDGQVYLVDDSTLVGYRFSTGWAKNQRVFFAARFSAPVADSRFYDSTGRIASRAGTGSMARTQLKFQTAGTPLLVRVALSSVSAEKALGTLVAEGALSFDEVVNSADSLWEAELAKIRIKGTPEMEKKFYTALYRTCLAPVLYSDIDGQYRNHDNRVRSGTQRKYTVFSLWDTFRALHPLFTLTQAPRLPAMMNSLLSFHDDNGLLPVWDLSTWETNTMTGYHAVPVLADAILKNLPGFDYEKAYAAMVKSAQQQQRGTPEYMRFGYLPQDKHGWSVTITLEYAFDDWCIAQVAKKLGKMEDYQYYLSRSQSYRRLFDPKTGFMRARDSLGRFIEPFDPLLSEHGFEGQYIEGTAWQHSFFVPHDVAGLAKLYGSRAALLAKMDTLFTTTSELHGENTSSDVSGLIGQYAHGNEPSHHIIYMYTELGQPKKAAFRVRQVVDSLYKLGPDGLSGNDDCGQMSAWLVWSALGMYPMNPASGEYVFGAPLVSEALMQLPNGRKLKIFRREKKSKTPQPYKARLNGKPIPYRAITHRQLLQGGTLEFIVN